MEFMNMYYLFSYKCTLVIRIVLVPKSANACSEPTCLESMRFVTILYECRFCLLCTNHLKELVAFYCLHGL
jgi:hypothetical protein